MTDEDEIKEVDTSSHESYKEFIEEHFEDEEAKEKLLKAWNKINKEVKEW